MTSYFRGKPAVPTTPDGQTITAKPSSNLFPNGTVMVSGNWQMVGWACNLMKRMFQDLYVYVSENELTPDFKSGKELIWEQNGIVYGDWTGGPNGDSSYELRTKISTSEV